MKEKILLKYIEKDEYELIYLVEKINIQNSFAISVILLYIIFYYKKKK